MARTIRMPSEADLPPGTRRDFVEVLFTLYRHAGRPALQRIVDTIDMLGCNGRASTETIRRMLQGQTVPANWDNVLAVAQALGDLANWDLDLGLTSQSTDSTKRELMEAWHRALDEPDVLYGPIEANPWAGQPLFSDDEPPF